MRDNSTSTYISSLICSNLYKHSHITTTMLRPTHMSCYTPDFIYIFYILPVTTYLCGVHKQHFKYGTYVPSRIHHLMNTFYIWVDISFQLSLMLYMCAYTKRVRLNIRDFPIQLVQDLQQFFQCSMNWCRTTKGRTHIMHIHRICTLFLRVIDDILTADTDHHAVSSLFVFLQMHKN